MAPVAAMDQLYKHAKWIVSSLAMAALVWRSSLDASACVLGAVANALFTKALKHVIAQARPPGARLHDPGMPSNHASALFYFAAFIAVTVVRTAVTPPRVCLAVSLPVVAGSASWYRVRSGLHTSAQVVVGAVVGFAFGVAWRLLPWARVEAVVATREFSTCLAAFVAVGLICYDPAERALRRALRG